MLGGPQGQHPLVPSGIADYAVEAAADEAVESSGSESKDVETAAKWFDLGDADPLITAVCT